MVKLAAEDTEITKRADGSLDFTDYRKPTSNGRYLHYRSSNPASHRQNTAIVLQKRALTIFSDEMGRLQD